MRLWFSAGTLFCLALVATGAQARLRAGQVPDPVLGPWFQSLTQPGTGIPCCSVSDCHETDFRIKDDHYEAWVDGQWRIVPPEAVLKRTDNPTGRAVACFVPILGIICFIRGPET